MTNFEKIVGILFVVFSVIIIIYNFSLTPSIFPSNKTETSQNSLEYSSSSVPSKTDSSEASNVSSSFSSAIPSKNSKNPSAFNNLININTATKEEITKLPGIGDVISQRIIDYRNEYGRFDSIDELQNVKGIGSVVFNKIKNLVTVD